jgi:hypothetical protein
MQIALLIGWITRKWNNPISYYWRAILRNVFGEYQPLWNLIRKSTTRWPKQVKQSGYNRARNFITILKNKSSWACTNKISQHRSINRKWVYQATSRTQLSIIPWLPNSRKRRWLKWHSMQNNFRIDNTNICRIWSISKNTADLVDTMDITLFIYKRCWT